MKLANPLNCKIAIIGLGYVGLPLAVEISKRKRCCKTGENVNRKIVGFDINHRRIEELVNCEDKTNEINGSDIKFLNCINFTSSEDDLINSDVFIVTVPTPIDKFKRPDLKAIINANITIGRVIKKSSSNIAPIIIYESTVYPGLTEEICVPILEEESGYLYNSTKDQNSFFCGYSPERINPGDKNHRLTNIVKLVSGCNEIVEDWIDIFYSSFIEAGTHKTGSIKVAEAAKVIENTQRDLNIALINELSIIFKFMKIDTRDVLKAAGTKWNFLPFNPGLVGGHCIGVDPYYLTYKSEQLGYRPEIVLAGRRMNDNMGSWIVEQLILGIAVNGKKILNSKILILGLTFKEDCPDLRNSKVFDVIKNLKKYGLTSEVVDPLVKKTDLKNNIEFSFENQIDLTRNYDGILCLVAHKEFKNLNEQNWGELIKKETVCIDLKNLIPRKFNPIRI